MPEMTVEQLRDHHRRLGEELKTVEQAMEATEAVLRSHGVAAVPTGWNQRITEWLAGQPVGTEIGTRVTRNKFPELSPSAASNLLAQLAEDGVLSFSGLAGTGVRSGKLYTICSRTV